MSAGLREQGAGTEAVMVSLCRADLPEEAGMSPGGTLPALLTPGQNLSQGLRAEHPSAPQHNT